MQVPVVQMVQRGASEIDAETIAQQRAGRGRQALRRQAKQQLGAETMRMLEKHIMLNVLDQNWKEHLARMDYLRQGIHLRGYAQKQPKQEYKKEAFELFSDMLEKVKREVVTLLARVRIRSEEEIAADGSAGTRAPPRRRRGRCSSSTPNAGGFGADEEAAQAQAAAQPTAAFANVGRNDPCPCGSGKKYKHCHGQLA